MSRSRSLKDSLLYYIITLITNKFSFEKPITNIESKLYEININDYDL